MCVRERERVSERAKLYKEGKEEEDEEEERRAFADSGPARRWAQCAAVKQAFRQALLVGALCALAAQLNLATGN